MSRPATRRSRPGTRSRWERGLEEICGTTECGTRARCVLRESRQCPASCVRVAGTSTLGCCFHDAETDRSPMLQHQTTFVRAWYAEALQARSMWPALPRPRVTHFLHLRVIAMVQASSSQTDDKSGCTVCIPFRGCRGLGIGCATGGQPWLHHQPGRAECVSRR